MSFFEKMITEQETAVTDWTDFLKAAHLKEPSMTPNSFAKYNDKYGFSSYENLAKKLNGDEKKILDLACGDGFLSSFIKVIAPESKILGVDMSEGELSVAREKFQSDDVTFLTANANDLPVENASQDTILSHMAIMLMNPIDPVIREVYRTLKPGGSFHAVIDRPSQKETISFQTCALILNFVREKYGISSFPETGDKRARKPEDLSELFRNSGFSSFALSEIDLQIKATEEDVLEHWKTMYFVGILPDDQKTEILGQIEAFLCNQANEDGLIEYTRPLWILSAEKPSL